MPCQSRRILTPRVHEIIRQFRENGLKLLLHNPGNVRDLLSLLGVEFVDDLDFDKMTVDPTTYVASDYRHLASDLVLRVPLRRRPGRGRQIVTLYVLIEHQSEPDPLMLLRVLDYLVQIWKGLVRARTRRGRLPSGFRLEPILPIVLYTGDRRWDDLGRLRDIVEVGAQFTEMIPDFWPLFLPLSTLIPNRLETVGGYFGWILELIQQRKARVDEFRNLLQRAVAHLEELPASDRLRWLELLSYISAMLYHDWEEPEREDLHELVSESVQTDEHRLEVFAMGKTSAEVLIERGLKQGLEQGREQGTVETMQKMLLRLLKTRFGKLPQKIQRTIRITQMIALLEGWYDRAMTVNTLSDIPFDFK